MNGVCPFFSNLDELKEVLNKLPKKSKIVYTYGAWDLLHPGHVIFLARARALGDFLILGVVADEPIKNLKGQLRPLQNQVERVMTSGSLRCVDAVILQSEYDPSEQLKTLERVDILTKGDDWDYIPGSETIEHLGGELIKLSYTEEFSTSNLVLKIE
jgi:rfaE bifunctional protein nucleotidyltransferase chain/domain